MPIRHRSAAPRPQVSAPAGAPLLIFISLIYHAVYDRTAFAAVIQTAVIISHTLRTEECLFYGRGAIPEIQRPGPVFLNVKPDNGLP